MRTFIFVIICLFNIHVHNAQDSLDALLNQYNDKSVPYISVQELAMPKTNAIILDAREQQEYDISHIKDAVLIGYDHFDINTVLNSIPNKDQMIVVYCSLGIRSETIAKQLKANNYTNVYNLYGGIFEWKNSGFEVFDTTKQPTEKVHTFSEEWSRWLTKGQKVHE